MIICKKQNMYTNVEGIILRMCFRKLNNWIVLSLKINLKIINKIYKNNVVRIPIIIHTEYAIIQDSYSIKLVKIIERFK